MTPTARDCFDRAVGVRREQSTLHRQFQPADADAGHGAVRTVSRGRPAAYERWWLDPSFRYGDATFVPRGMTPDNCAKADGGRGDRSTAREHRAPDAVRAVPVARPDPNRTCCSRPTWSRAERSAQAGPSARHRRALTRPKRPHEDHVHQAEHRADGKRSPMWTRVAWSRSTSACSPR